MRKIWLVGLLTAAGLWAQPATVAAAHVRFGAGLPATCNPATGDVFFLTSGTTGVYSCTSLNTWTQPGSAGGVSSVGLTVPSWLTVANSPVTTTGTLAVTAATGQTSHQVIGTCGSGTTFAPCLLVFGDLPAITSVSLSSPLAQAQGGLATAKIAFTPPTTAASIAFAADNETVTLPTGTLLANTRTINTTSPLGGGGDLSADRTLTCATCVVASSPGVGIAHFPGSTQTATSSLIVNADITNATIDLTSKVTNALPAANMAASVRAGGFGATFDGGGSVLVAGKTYTARIPYACTISSWSIVVNAGTATVDVWKIASGSSGPSVANTITASAIPAISSGTATSSTTLTGWTTAVAANDIVGINLKVVASATIVGFNAQCDK